MAKAKTKRGLLSRLLRRDDGPGGPNVNWLASFLVDAMRSRTGKAVTVETTLQVTAALACMRVISEDTSICPIIVKTRAPGAGDQWQRAPDHWIIRRFRRPNEWQTEIEFRSMMTAHATITHGGYAFINRQGGQVAEFLPYPPQSVKAVQKNWVLTYEVTHPSGAREIIPAANMLHLRGITWDGLNGIEAIKVLREALGIALAAEESHALLHKNGVKTSGILTTNPTAPSLSDESATRIAKQWREEFGPDSDNAFGVAVLEGGMKFEAMGMSGIDAQHLETRKFQIEEICRGFRVYPQLIGHAAASTLPATSAEQIFLSHVNHTITPWCVRWEQLIDKMMLAQSSEPNTWVTLDVRGLQRGDSATRSSYYNSAIHGGWLNRNEARDMEGLERGPAELDTYLSPMQLAPGGSADATNAKNDSSSTGAP